MVETNCIRSRFRNRRTSNLMTQFLSTWRVDKQDSKAIRLIRNYQLRTQLNSFVFTVTKYYKILQNIDSLVGDWNHHQLEMKIQTQSNQPIKIKPTEMNEKIWRPSSCSLISSVTCSRTTGFMVWIQVSKISPSWRQIVLKSSFTLFARSWKECRVAV